MGILDSIKGIIPDITLPGGFKLTGESGEALFGWKRPDHPKEGTGKKTCPPGWEAVETSSGTLCVQVDGKGLEQAPGGQKPSDGQNGFRAGNEIGAGLEQLAEEQGDM